jgi:hypothetical protein
MTLPAVQRHAPWIASRLKRADRKTERSHASVRRSAQEGGARTYSSASTTVDKRSSRILVIWVVTDTMRS